MTRCQACRDSLLHLLALHARLRASRPYAHAHHTLIEAHATMRATDAAHRNYTRHKEHCRGGHAGSVAA